MLSRSQLLIWEKRGHTKHFLKFLPRALAGHRCCFAETFRPWQHWSLSLAWPHHPASSQHPGLGSCSLGKSSLLWPVPLCRCLGVEPPCQPPPGSSLPLESRGGDFSRPPALLSLPHDGNFLSQEQEI